MKLINLIKTLSYKQKIIIGATLGILLTITTLIVIYFSYSKKYEDVIKEHDTLSYPISPISYPVSTPNIKIPEVIIPVPEDDNNKNTYTEEIIVNDINLGLKLKNKNKYSISLSDFNDCDSDKNVVNIYPDSEYYFFPKKQFYAHIVNRNLVNEQEFDTYKDKFIAKISNPEDATNPFTLYSFCGGAGYTPVALLNYKFSDFDHSLAYLYIGGSQAPYKNIRDVNFTTFVYAYDDINLIQIEHTIQYLDSLNEDYKNDCIVESNDGVENYIDNTCLAQKLSQDSSIINLMNTITFEGSVQVGFEKNY